MPDDDVERKYKALFGDDGGAAFSDEELADMADGDDDDADDRSERYVGDDVDKPTPSAHDQLEGLIGESVAGATGQREVGRVGDGPTGLRAKMLGYDPDLADDSRWGAVVREASRLERSGATQPEPKHVGIDKLPRTEWLLKLAADSIASGTPPPVGDEMSDEDFVLDRQRDGIKGEQIGAELAQRQHDRREMAGIDREFGIDENEMTEVSNREDQILNALQDGRHQEAARLAGRELGTPRKGGFVE